jgi:glycine/D-amino acid oxidase-like deaminating enzyme
MLQINQLSFWEKQSFFEEIDFVVIGAGIVGYSAAINLKRKYPAAKIVILERGYLPSGASSKNAGFACFGSPTEIFDDLANSDENEVWNTINMRFEGLQELKDLVKNYDIDFQKKGSWDLIHDDYDHTEISRDFIEYLNINCLKLFGVDKIYSEDNKVDQKFGFQSIKTSYFNKEEGQLDTGKLIKALHQISNSLGITSLFGIELIEFEESMNKVILKSNVGEIQCHKLLICTNGFAGKFLGSEVKPARAQVLVTSEIPNLPFKGTFHLDRGYYYFRNVGNRILLGGARNLDFEGETTTEINTTPIIQDALSNLLKSTIIPNIDYQIDYSWAGIMGVGETKKPIIRKQSNNVAFGVRMGGMGVAIGSIVGKELSRFF